MLSLAELNRMRTVAEQALPGTAVIQSSVFVSDNGGGGSLTWTAAGTVSCRLAPVQPTMPDERVSGGRISPDAEFVVTLPFGTDVDEKDRLVIGGSTYDVAAIRDRSYKVTTRVEAVKQT